MSELLARWHKLSKRKQWLIASGFVLLALMGMGALSGGDDPAPAATDAPAVEETTEEAEPVAAPTAPSVAGKMPGRFHRDCLACGDLAHYISVNDVWCGWRGEDLIVHVRMHNDSAEKVTVNWHPSYTVARGSDHGTGLTSIQDDGLESGESRTIEVIQHPEGVTPGASLSVCKPSFYLVQSG